MRTYQVGGAVRDELLGLPVEDRDFVVVGATPEEMEHRGFKPVGRDFPVFLHPETQEEYALARTERKSGRGYRGFVVHAAPEVTLEEDLARRDLTINAIAKDEAGNVIDPHGGVADLRAGVLRHVGPAFVEDPVRLLRVARFAARFGFSVAPETRALMREMVANGEVDHLVPERAWQELARGLMERDPVRMLDELEACGALVRILPEWGNVDAVGARAALAAATVHRAPLPVRFALLLIGADAAAVQSVAARLRAPNECAELAELRARHGESLAHAGALDAAALVALLQQADAYRRPARFELLLQSIALQDDGAVAGALNRVRRALAAATSVDAGVIAKAHPGGEADAVLAARIQAVAAGLGD